MFATDCALRLEIRTRLRLKTRELPGTEIFWAKNRPSETADHHTVSAHRDPRADNADAAALMASADSTGRTTREKLVVNWPRGTGIFRAETGAG